MSNFNAGQFQPMTNVIVGGIRELNKEIERLTEVNTELLQAAIDLVDQTKDGLGNNYDDGEFPALDRLRAAIAKAMHNQEGL